MTLVPFLFSCVLITTTPEVVSFEMRDADLLIKVCNEGSLRYVFRDDSVRRPFFWDVNAPGNSRVTRNFPPQKGIDPDDHASFHPGIWLAFGDINGVDFWRNSGRIEHKEFVGSPKLDGTTGHFTVLNRYIAPDGSEVCDDRVAYTVSPRGRGFVLGIDASIGSALHEVVFGDQEEMGLGVRLHTPLTVKYGDGQILNAEGGRNEAGVWGKTSAWCTYGNSASGIAMVPHADNFRPCWFHARDYGLLVANPFGIHAFMGGPESHLRVKKGERLHLRFAVLIFAGAAPPPPDLEALRTAEPAR